MHTCKRRNVYQYYNLYTYTYLLSGKAERKANKRRKQTPLRNQTERRLYHHRRVHLRMRNKNQSGKKVWAQALPRTAIRLCHCCTIKGVNTQILVAITSKPHKIPFHIVFKNSNRLVQRFDCCQLLPMYFITFIARLHSNSGSCKDDVCRP